MKAEEKSTTKSEGEPKSGPPSISLPKGGGAIRGIGEKFAANPVTGTGSMSVPIATSPGRAGFGPQLSLSYDSGAGNGPFGLGWSLSLPQVTRKTEKGLPQYKDAEESYVFILSGAEDLVPEFETKPDGTLLFEKDKPVIYDKERKVDGIDYNIRRYRPRIEGLFARIERWTNDSDATDVHWRSISKDNILTIYGKDENSRIADPTDLERIFTWLICETRDDKGNAILYTYKKEDGEKVNLALANERNRGPKDAKERSSNRYLKSIRYGNRTTLLDDKGHRPTFLSTSQIKNTQWMFEVVFDYGEHDDKAPKPPKQNDAGVWECRNDPFSSYRAGFEVRTYRLCKRVLMFHHFPEEPEVKADCLVRSTNFTYWHEDHPDDSRNLIFSFLSSVSQRGYQGNAESGYRSRTLPPVEFSYTEAIIEQKIRELDLPSLENLPHGLDGKTYQWVDLDGEGLSGILTEQADAWFYKRNLSPLRREEENGALRTVAQFGPLELVAAKPSMTIAGGSTAQFLDLAGDGQIDLVEFSGTTPGFFERTTEGGWEPFTPFTSLPNIAWQDSNLRFIDLNGDGHADVMLSEDYAFTWFPSLGEDGFAQAERVSQPFDEEQGPTLIFADPEQSIYLADMSGDGLTDLVRLRNGEICYWPNLGYGRFGAKVTMDNAPWFDCPDQFDQKRIRLGDIDGSGTADVFYLSGAGVRLWRNQSGNSWSDPEHLQVCPPIHNLASMQVLDLLGNGTACLVWSSPLPTDAPHPLRYVDLMGGQKPHLLTKVINNLGTETLIEYAPSTKFYLQDRKAGKPWITKLPFPVHCVEKVTIKDRWRQTSFSTTYSYHHGYFDGIEREFRGFGRVEQIDVEDYGTFAANNGPSPYITPDQTLYQPPVKTVTWYHTGAFLDRKRILNHFEQEYFPHWLKDLYPDLTISFQENPLPQPDLEMKSLSAEEWREALRACKGMMLRQEVTELDIQALERPKNPEQLPVKLFSTAYHNCHIRRLQPREGNRHAVFLVAESEAITYHYELDIREEQLPKLSPDPRIAHTLNLQYDEYGNVLQSVDVVYPRIGQFEDDGLGIDELKRIRDVQLERHVAYSETRYSEDFGTKPADKIAAQDNHRLRVPCETLTYELTGIKPAAGLHFTLNELRAFQLSLVHQTSGTSVPDSPYHKLLNSITLGKRLVEHARTLFFKENLVDPLPFKEHGRLGLTYEASKLALTDTLLDAVFKEAAGNKLDQAIDGAMTVRDKLRNPAVSGYLNGAVLAARFQDVDTTGQYWIRSGIAGFAADAAQHFYLPERYTDPFDNQTTLAYDPRDLFVMSSTDMLGNKTEVTHFDFRVLAPREMKDINDNLSEVYFDVLGLPTAMVVKGKGKGMEGDSLIGFDDALANPTLDQLTAFFITAKPYDEAQARAWLGNATARHVYYFGEVKETLPAGNTQIRWGQHPSCACGIVRERHVSQLGPGEASPVQTAFEYSDGMGCVLVKKVQAEPEEKGQALRWIASGKTILNNKGKPVKQYEPFFSLDKDGHPNHRYEEPKEKGVTPIIYYDAVGRAMRTEMPDGSFSRVEFSPWYVRTYDSNDTAFNADPTKRSDWYERRMNPAHEHFAEFNSPENTRAAKLVEVHADTPALTILDSLGRDVISIAHNKVKDSAGAFKDEKYLTFTKLDAEGKPLWIRDARKNLVMQYINPPVPNNQATDPVDKFVPCYDIAGNLLFQHSMDAGERWMLNDAAGKPMLAWDSRGHVSRTDYDVLHRPIGSLVKGADPTDANRIIQFEKIIYGDTPANGLTDAQKTQLNLRGRPYQHHDTAGIVISKARNPVNDKDEAFDFKGNPLRTTRQLVKEYKNTPDWSQNPVLETEIFTSSTRYDALNRPIQLIAPHSDRPGTKLNVIRPGYNEANLLERMDVWLEQAGEPTDLLNPTTASERIGVENLDYNEKGQRTKIEYKNGVSTICDYYSETFRLKHLQTLRSAERVQDLFYTYDPVGNITEIRDAAQPTVFFNNISIAPSNAYEYDAIYRLIHAEGREHAAQNNAQRDAKSFEPIIGIPFPNSPEALQRYAETYEYDSVGNILGMHHRGGSEERWVRWYQYALDSNRLLATQSPGDAKLPFYVATPGYTAKYSYDFHGNMTSMPHLPTMEWDFKDQLCATKRQVGPGEKTYYVYDAGGERVRKITENKNEKRTNERIYLGGFEVFRTFKPDDAIALERETLHVMDDKQRIALIETRTFLDTGTTDPAPPQLVRYQLGNHLGSAVLEMNDEAQVISYEEFHPYGTTAYQAARNQTDMPKRYRYTGKERDEETGFTYHGARYYAPWLGRWTTNDPAGMVDGMNLYEYVKSNPIHLFDKNGMGSGTNNPDIDWARAALRLTAPNNSSPIRIDLTQEQEKNLSENEKVFSETEKDFERDANSGRHIRQPEKPEEPKHPLKVKVSDQVMRDAKAQWNRPNTTPAEKAAIAFSVGMMSSLIGFEWVANIPDLFETAGEHGALAYFQPNFAGHHSVRGGFNLALGVSEVSPFFKMAKLEAPISTAVGETNSGRSVISDVPASVEGIGGTGEGGVTVGRSIGAAAVDDPSVFTGNQSLAHYTTKEGLDAILKTGKLNPSLKAINPKDVRYGEGQYFTDVIPGSRTPGGLSSAFVRNPWQGRRFSHYVEIDSGGLNVYMGREGVFVIHGGSPLNISDRIRSFGEAY